VGRAAPFHCTTDCGTKPTPERVKVKPGLPAVTEPGAIPEMLTAGLAIVKETAEEAPPPGAPVKTVTDAEPGKAVSPAGMLAESVEELTKEVDLAEPFH